MRLEVYLKIACNPAVNKNRKFGVFLICHEDPNAAKFGEIPPLQYSEELISFIVWVLRIYYSIETKRKCFELRWERRCGAARIDTDSRARMVWVFDRLQAREDINLVSSYFPTDMYKRQQHNLTRSGRKCQTARGRITARSAVLECRNGLPPP